MDTQLLQTNNRYQGAKSLEIELGKSAESEMMKDYIGMKEAVIDIATRSITSSISFYVEYLAIFLNIVFISYLNEPVLVSACGMGQFLLNLSVAAIDVGLCGGIDTLASQAFGRKDYVLWGVYLNTARIVISVLFLFQAFMLLNAESILIAFGQSAEVAEIASTYCLYLMPGIFMYMQFEWKRRHLFWQGIYRPVLNTMFITTSLHIVSLYIFVIVFDLKVLGVAVSTTITYSLDVILINYLLRSNPNIVVPQKWFLIDKEAFMRIIPYLKYGIPGAIMWAMEWWGYDIINIFSGILGVNQLSTGIIIFQMFIMIVMNSVGITFAATGPVGNSLGANLPNRAKRYALAANIFGAACAIFSVIVHVLFKNKFILAFTSNPEIVEFYDEVFIFYMWALFCDQMQIVNGGILRAMGYQNAGSIIQGVALFVVMNPLAYILAFKCEYGFIGIWMAVPVGSFLMMIGFLVILFTSDWRTIAINASHHEKDDSLLKFEQNIPGHCVSHHLSHHSLL